MSTTSTETRQPALFIGHGDPMMALRHDAISEGLASVGERLKAHRG